MDKKSSSAGGGAGFTSLLLVAFIVLKLCHVIDWPWVSAGIIDACDWVKRRIKELPSADVRPVVRGRWVDGKCDNCGEHAPYWCLATTFHESNFCPNCGADMREVQE